MKHLSSNSIITTLIGVTLFVALCLFPPTYAAGIADMSGTWQIVDDKGKSHTSFHLHQQGASVTGTIIYTYGQAPVQGSISGNRLNLTVIYDNEKVLNKWLSPPISRQVIGITSRYEITIVPEAEELKGTFYGYWVSWNGNTVTGKYDGGSAEALQHTKPKTRILRRTVPSPGGPSMVQMSPMMKLDRARYIPGEQIKVFFNALPDFRQNAWIGIIPSHIEHGSEAKNDQYDLTYQYLKGRTSGTLLFTAPARPGQYDFRMHDTDDNGTEVASVTFSVGSPQMASGTPTAAGICHLIDHIRKGTPFVVTFDMTAEKFNDANFTGDYRTDPMGTLMGGKSYRVFYRNGTFTCKGYSQHARSVITHTDGGANPDDGLISLWGRGYAFDGKGQVYDRDYGLVGHLRMER